MSEHSTSEKESRRYLAVLTLGALGVVYGDIGTSPLYALRECFSHHSGLSVTEPLNIFGVLSLIIWSIIIIVSLKYILLVLRADNRGEGGELALLALLMRRRSVMPKPLAQMALWAGLFGASLLYGDGVITPAISVLSAVEGLKIVTDAFEPFVVPLTLIILTCVFLVQRRGTASIGAVFGPIILMWFLVLALLGIRGIMLHPAVLSAVSPHHALEFVFHHGRMSFLVMGSVFLAVTGAEALYADMGHFGRKPIRIGWFLVVFPGLLLNYLGQGALLLSDPTAIENPFYRLAPSWALMPLIVLSTTATVIASQALISGAFSITRQAVQLGFLPRLEISHTSSREIGQIYVPVVNWLLLAATLLLVLAFRTSSNLAATYGIAVSTTMVITTFLIFLAAVYVWRWKLVTACMTAGVFFIVDIYFLSANFTKLWSGGWVPLVLGVGVFTIMTTWWRGRQILAQRLVEHSIQLEDFIEELSARPVTRVPGVALFMARNNEKAPTALIQNTKHNRCIHEKVIVLRVVTEEHPYVPSGDRVASEYVSNGFYRMTIRYGFMEAPDIPAVLAGWKLNGLELVPKDITFFLGREIVLATDRPGMAIWRERLFGVLTSLSLRATAFFEIPSDQVIEIGTQVEM